MKNNIFQLFVYGSLRSGFRNPAYQYLARYFHLLGDATVKGKLYDMGEYAAAIATNEERFIHGELYEINEPSEFDWAIAQLDDYEGINMEAGEHPMYKREAVNAYLNGTEQKTWIYWFNSDTSGYPEVTSGDMMQYLQQKNKQ
jgi:gamma-glutamylcyclotransferase (GGCT)/AIG2-like uncharacterized protein YtfP